MIRRSFDGSLVVDPTVVRQLALVSKDIDAIDVRGPLDANLAKRIATTCASLFAVLRHPVRAAANSRKTGPPDPYVEESQVVYLAFVRTAQPAVETLLRKVRQAQTLIEQGSVDEGSHRAGGVTFQVSNAVDALMRVQGLFQKGLSIEAAGMSDEELFARRSAAPDEDDPDPDVDPDPEPKAAERQEPSNVASRRRKLEAAGLSEDEVVEQLAGPEKRSERGEWRRQLRLDAKKVSN